MPLTITTIGVYGFTESAFFHTLLNSKVSVLCDIRRRRAVRGSRFAFANSKRLQAKLTQLGIRYIYAKELAPSNAIRQLQKQADKSAQTTKSTRHSLSDSFVVAYQAECLSHFHSKDFVHKYHLANDTIAFLCVESEPSACHRSIVAERFAHELETSIIHLRPGDDRAVTAYNSGNNDAPSSEKD